MLAISTKLVFGITSQCRYRLKQPCRAAFDASHATVITDLVLCSIARLVGPPDFLDSAELIFNVGNEVLLLGTIPSAFAFALSAKCRSATKPAAITVKHFTVVVLLAAWTEQEVVLDTVHPPASLPESCQQCNSERTVSQADSGSLTPALAANFLQIEQREEAGFGEAFMPWMSVPQNARPAAVMWDFPAGRPHTCLVL